LGGAPPDEKRKKAASSRRTPKRPEGKHPMTTRTEPIPATPRLASIDAYRGLVMFLMMAEVLHLSAVARAFPGSDFWAFLAYHQSHVEWIGCSLHDLIQPSFSFLVGVALPFSIASRRARGQSLLMMTAHAFWRALVLVALGIFLRSTGRPQTNYTFEDTLTQIGLGYGFLFLLGLRPMRDQWIALVLILAGYWAAFWLYPLPTTDFDYQKVGVSAAWLRDHGLTDLTAHWNKNSNLAWEFDRWFLNLFPREKAFTHNGGGYATLSFIPTLGTMILGLIACGVLRNWRTNWGKVLWLTSAGVVCLALGLLLHRLGVCPVVKRIWTPSWTIYSGGWCFLFLAAFYTVIDVWQCRTWAFPLMVIGMNSIAAYLMAHLFEGFLFDALKCHLGEGFFTALGKEYQPLLLGGGVLLVLWLLLFYLYRQKVFLRI
jgi:heparan-alpha-glucosaminide N-acetyltransferase